MKSRKPFYLRFRCTKSRRVFGRRPKLVPGRRLMKDEKRCGRPTGLPASLFFILIPKRKELSRGPAPFRLVDRAKPARYAAGKSCELFSYDICYDISYDIYYDMSMSAPCN